MAMNERVVNNLREAIRTMRDFVDTAERELDRQVDSEAPDANEHAIGIVQAKFGWGLANASSSIQNAIMTVGDLRIRAELDRG